MSYSRWMTSRWYTFWCSPAEGVVEDKDTALFEICLVGSFNAKQLRDDMDKCLNHVKCIEYDEYKNLPNEYEMLELKGYMLEFLADVDKEFGNKN